MKDEFARWLREDRLIAIVRNASTDAACETARELIDGGIRLLEFSLTAETALESLERIAGEFQGKALIGAGTVLTLADAQRAVSKGAGFLVSPVLLPDVLSWSNEQGVPAIPGALTPQEVWQAHAAGAELIKIFPAGAFGPRYIRDLLGPFPSLQLVPTGGVTLGDSEEYLRTGATAVALATALTGRAGDDSSPSARARELLARLRDV